ncbi:photosynthetic reaction center subunit H [uncultured Bradyrhizobium sp.]|uniref:photosynthetic reaction center subunit H n=1 Tax=uncultured Bradyrhizobium sp. TaxID=199684 RepID=UPI0035CA40C4
MQSGAYLDVAQVTLYVFWIFFACLIFYLRREDKREGYPLDSTSRGGGVVHGFPRMPDPKSYLLSSGHIATLPNHKNDRRDVAVASIARWPGAPGEPTGNPMLDGVGPGSWADREDAPELNIDKIPCIVPLRVAEGTFLESRDPDPRGMLVVGADREIAGVVTDVWVDRAEALIRYLEVEVGGTANVETATVVAVTPVTVMPPSGVPVPAAVVEVASVSSTPQVPSRKRVLLPMTFAKIDGRRGRVRVSAILGGQFADVPVTASPNQITKLEEDRIVGYYGGGMLYATPARQEPLL